MRFFKVNGIYINLDNVNRFFIQQEIDDWKIYADLCDGSCVKISEHNSEKQAKIDLDLIMTYIKEGKDEY